MKTILDNKFNDSGCKSENNEITYTRVRPFGIVTIIYHSNWIPKSSKLSNYIVLHAWKKKNVSSVKDQQFTVSQFHKSKIQNSYFGMLLS